MIYDTNWSHEQSRWTKLIKPGIVTILHNIKWQSSLFAKHQIPRYIIISYRISNISSSIIRTSCFFCHVLIMKSVWLKYSTTQNTHTQTMSSSISHRHRSTAMPRQELLIPVNQPINHHRFLTSLQNNDSCRPAADSFSRSARLCPNREFVSINYPSDWRIKLVTNFQCWNSLKYIPKEVWCGKCMYLFNMKLEPLAKLYSRNPFSFITWTSVIFWFEKS